MSPQIIIPSAGAGLLNTQGGVGTTPGYGALDDRRANNIGLQEGVYGPTDFKVVQRGAGANMSVDITMTAGGSALVQGDSIAGQGLYVVPVHATTINELVSAAHATLPRIDQVILRVFDNAHDASGQSKAQVEVLAGVATSGATLDNRTGATALPASAMRLADVLVPAASTTVVTANIRDRRSWARGLFVHVLRYSNFAGSNDYGAPAAFANIDSVNLNRRVEFSGAPVRINMRGTTRSTVANGETVLRFLDNGGYINGINNNLRLRNPTANIELSFILEMLFLPAAGSHLLAPDWQGGGTTWLASPSSALEFTIEELVRQNASND